MFDIYLKLAALAHPVIKNYAADFYLHDARVLETLRPGDVALWAPRESGSFLTIVARGRIANERALESIRAAVSAFPGLDWQLIDTNSSGIFEVESIDEAAAVALVKQYLDQTRRANSEAIASGGKPVLVSELHM